jgi:prepilin-type N-terminal cleavage/methylation domain-containing protein
MNRQAFTLVELLIVVAIIAVLVGAVLPYFENYVRETKVTKAKHELNILKEALIKYETLEDKRFTATDTTLLIGRYLQNVANDPWGRPYEIEPYKGFVMSRGFDNIDANDDIIMDFKPPLTLTKAVWVDGDNNSHITASDAIRLEFTRLLEPGKTLTFSSVPGANVDLIFSPEVKHGSVIATQTPSSLTYLLLPIGANDDTIFFPGSSTVQVASGNVNLIDLSGRKAAGSQGEYPSLPVIIQGN